MKITIYDEDENQEIVAETDNYEFSVKGIDGVLTININVPHLMKMELTESETRILGGAVVTASKMTKNKPKGGCCDDEEAESKTKKIDPWGELITPHGEDEPVEE
jgi:hypothetical protein